MGPVAYDENERENGCPYREIFVDLDGSRGYVCRLLLSGECKDQHSEKFCCDEGD